MILKKSKNFPKIDNFYLTNPELYGIIITEREVISMKIYGIFNTNGVLLGKIAKRSISDAEAWFKETYPHKAFAYICEM